MSIHHLCRPLISIKRRHRNHDLFRANRMYNCCQKFRCAIAAQHLRFFYRWLQICCDLLNQFSTSLLRVYHDMFQSLPQSIFQRIRSSQWIDIHRKVIFYVVIVYISPMNILITVHTFSSFIEHQPMHNLLSANGLTLSSQPKADRSKPGIHIKLPSGTGVRLLF